MTLDEQYKKTIEDQRAHLLAVQDEFNKECEAAKLKAEERLKTVAETDTIARGQILQEQKAELEAALTKLKTEVNHSTKGTMKKLEEIVRQKEALLIDGLEKQLATL